MDEFDPNFLRKLTRFPNFHHSSPLVYYPQRLIKQAFDSKGLNPRLDFLKDYVLALSDLEQAYGGGLEVSVEPSSVYARIFTMSTTSELNPDYHHDTRMHDRLLKCVFRDTLHELKSIEAAHPGLLGMSDSLSIPEAQVSDIMNPMSTLISLRLFMINIRNCFQQRYIASNVDLSTAFKFLPFEIHIINEIVIVRDASTPRIIHLLNYDQWLMLTDTISCRFMVRVACNINDLMKTDQLPSWHLISSIYRWGDELLSQEGINAYAVIGEFESFVTGAFVTFQNSDPLQFGQDYISSIMEQAAETMVNYDIPIKWTERIMHILQTIASLNYLSEIFGLRKHWGNPMVDAAASGSAVQEKLSENLPISSNALILLLASFNRMITVEFMKQHGQWPECVFAPLIEPYPLYNCWLNKVTRIPEHHPKHMHFHWSLLRFLPNITMHGYDDQLRLLSDKSVSLHRHGLDSIYIQKLCSPEFRSRPLENRRLMLEFLRTKQHSILDIFKTVMTGKTPVSWLANSASMKGTEMKHEKARIFAVLTFEMRQYFAATEDIIKSELFKYNPHQTMTMNEQELLKRLRQITRQMDPNGTSRVLSVVHIIDFSKWNLRMKYENTCLIFKSMDDFLGTPGLIENSHLLFLHMINLVQDPFNPPSNGVANTESDTIWRLHSAGWEGQRQKGWTLLTSALLSDLERQTGIKSEICGQGDNQVLLSSFPIPNCYRNPADWIKCDLTGVRTIVDAFYRELENECMSIGLKIKTAETCRSLCYLNYGKRLYFNGVELSMMLKRISKSITEPNNTFPTTESLLKTSEGASYSAGLYSHPSVLPYLISRFSLMVNLSESFSRNPLVNDFGKKQVASRGMEFNTQFISRLSKIPPCLGGPPQLSMASYMYRGHPDPVCSDIVMLTLKARINCGISQRILTLMADGQWFDMHIRSRESLIKSPYMLNMTLPKSALNPIQESLLPAVESYCKNPDIKDLFSSRVSNHESDILGILSTMEPFHPLVANDIYGRTVPGRRNALLLGLSNTTSLGRLIYEAQNSPIITCVADLEMRQLELWIGRVYDVVNAMQVDTHVWEIPHHELVQQTRDGSWGCKIVGVTVPHPLEQFSIVKARHDICTADCSGLLKEHIVMVRHSEDLVVLPGIDAEHVTTQRSRHGNPYLGSTMNEGLSQRSIFCLNPNQTWTDLVRLNTLRKWITSENSNLDSTIKWLIGTRTNLQLETLNLATGAPSRLSYSHRAALMAVVRTCAVSTTSNMHSRMYLSSNRMESFSHGDFNYHMPFGPAFLLYQSLICLQEVLMKKANWQLESREVYHAHVRQQDVPIVFDGKLNTTRRRPLSRPYMTVPKALYCKSGELLFSDNKHVVSSSLYLMSENATLSQCKEGYACQLIGNSLVSEITIRETMTMASFQHFPSREASITIGDVRLVGIGKLCRTLASNIYLLSPFSIILTTTREEFHVLTLQFLNSISSSFWNQFSIALSSYENLKSLVRKSDGYLNFQVSISNQGSTDLLKLCVAGYMWKIHKGIDNHITNKAKHLNFNLFAPTMEAARYCWSKFVEIVVCRLCKSCKLTAPEIISYCRDFSANVHSLDVKYLSSIVCCIRRDYECLKGVLGAGSLPGLPEVNVLDLQYPWIDRLRIANLPTASIEDSVEMGRVTSLPKNPNVIEFVIPSKLIYYEYAECKCNQLKMRRTMHEECFFCPTGLLSKSHYGIMDIINSRNLPVKSVIVLSSATGTEALAVSSLEGCEKVYSQSNRPLKEYSPHMAGTYVPPAFVNQPTIFKLQKSRESATAFTDIRFEDGTESVDQHVVSMLATGLYADLTSNEYEIFDDMMKSVLNILTLISNVTSVMWAVLKMRSSCCHNGMIMIGLLGQMFEIVSIEDSLFAHPGSCYVYLVGEKRFKGRLFHKQMKIFVPVGLGKEEDLRNFYLSKNSRLHPNISYLPQEQRNKRISFNCLQKSLKQACSNYIPGWGSSYNITFNTTDVRDSLSDVSQALAQAAVEIVRIAGRVAHDDLMVRSSILSLDSGPIYSQVNNLHILKYRADLLRELLNYEEMDFRRVDRVCSSRLSQDLTFQFLGATFPLSMNVSKFYDVYSRYMYEILGFYYEWKCHQIVDNDGAMLYHKTCHMDTDNLEIEEVDIRYGSCNITELRVDNRWRWARRSEVLFLLLSVKLLSSSTVSFCTPHDYVIEDTLRVLTILDCKVDHIHSSHALGEPLDALWAPGLTVVSLLEYQMKVEFLVIMEIRYIDELREYYHILGCYRVPWLGLIPDEVAFHCYVKAKPGTPTEFIGYPDILAKVDRICGKSYYAVGCGCADCVIESTLIQPYNISHYDLDKLCSIGSLESVRDMTH